MPLLLPQEVLIRNYAFVSVGKYIARHGRNCLIIAGKHFLASEDFEIIISSLTLSRVEYEVEEYPGGEPEAAYINLLAERYGAGGGTAIKCVAAIGGGSVIDTGKALAGLLTNGSGIEAYLDAPDKRIMENPPLPFIAIPTTAGTGAEATPNAVIRDKDKKYKKSFRDSQLLANTVVIDASLYLDMPHEIAANAGMDALAQLVEAFVSLRATAETDEYCRQGLRRIIYLAAAVNDGGISAVGETALAAFQSGVAIANAGVGAVHALASGIGAYTDLPHGLICGILLPRVMEINLSYSLKKYAEIGRILTGGDGRDSEMAESAVKAVRGLAGALGIPNSFRSAGESGIADIAEAVVDACADGGSMQSNPRPFERQVWVDLLKKFK